MTGMWEAYFAETSGCETLTSEAGFVCFQDTGEALFIHHVYILPEFRSSEEGGKLLEKLKERAAGKKRLITCCDQTIKTYVASLKAQLNYGFKISAVSGTVVYTYLELEGQDGKTT